MADRNLVYRVQINTSQAKGEAKQFAAQIKAELSNIKINVLDGRAFAGADKQIAKLRTELQSLATVQAPKIAIDTTGLQQAAQQADNLERQLREAETQARRTSAATRSVQPARTTTPGVGGGAVGSGGLNLGGIGSQLLGVAGISLTVAGIAQIAVGLEELRTQSLRSNRALQELAGGSAQATAALQAVRNASNGTVSELQAQQIAVQGLALNLAKTPAEFEKLVTAAKQITLISPTIKDLGSALTELSLFAANEKSFARADQLGVSVSEVKDRMAELQKQDESLSGSQAKLLATMAALNDKLGDVTNSSEAQASGLESFTRAVADLRAEVAKGPIGLFIDTQFKQGANFVDAARVALGSQDSTAVAGLLKTNFDKIAESQKQAAERGYTDAAAIYKKQLADIQSIINAQQLANEALAQGTPGAEEFASKINAFAAEAAGAMVPSEELVFQVGMLAGAYARATAAVGQYTTTQSNADAANDARADLLEQARESLNAAVGEQASNVAGTLGFDKAAEIAKQEIAKIEQEIARLQDSKLKGVELDIAVNLLSENIEADFDNAISGFQDQFENSIAIGLSASFGEGIAQLNTGIADASPVLTGIRDRLIELETQVTSSGSATMEMVAEYRELSAVADSVASSTGVYAALQNEAGEALLTSNSYAAGLASNIAILDGNLASGKISAEEHAGAMRSLVTALIAAAIQAGLTGESIAGLQAILAGLPTTGGAGFGRGTRFGENTAAILKAQEDARLREENRKAAERAAREQEQAAKRAGREMESAAKRAAKALESSLQNVEGLLSLSKVTQRQIDLAALGVPQNFADDFVRRFRDVVENGTQRNDVSIEQVKQALANVGIQPADDLKVLLGQLEDAWQNSSLFANKDNLGLINADAVQQSLDLQEKMKQGRENIMAFFGVAIDDATGAVSAVGADPTAADGLKTAVSDGKQKIVDHLTTATTAAVDAATAGTGATTTAGTGTAQISAVTIAPKILADLFANVDLPAITIDEIEIGDSVTQGIVTALGAQIATDAAQLGAQGGTLAASIREGFLTYWVTEGSSATMVTAIRVATASQIIGARESFATQGEEVADAIKDGFTAAWITNGQGTNLIGAFLNAYVSQKRASINLVAEEGLILANAIMSGYVRRFTEAAGETTLADAFRNAFGIQVQAIRDRLISSGNEAADIIQEGFVTHWTGGGKAVGGGANLGGAQGGLAGSMVDALSAQLVSSSDRLDALGGGVANFIMLGLASFDFGSAGDGMINQIESSMRSDATQERLVSVGASVADALFNGFAARIPDADWVGIIVAAVIAQLNSGVQAE